MLENTYFGFTDNMKPMQKTRAENTLDKLLRTNGEVKSDKEWVLTHIIDGYVPKIQENYSYYSVRIDDYTKPRNLYKLENDEGSYYEVTKTAHDFGLYLIEKGITNLEAAVKYADAEKAQLELERQEEVHKRLQKQKEEDQKRLELEKEKERRHAEKIAIWKVESERVVSEKVFKIINETVKKHIENLDDISSDNISKYTEENTERIVNEFGNQDYIIHNASYVFVDNPGSENLRNMIDKRIYKQVFNISESDPKITITAKIKAFYDGREYKGNKPVTMHPFYIYKKDAGYEKCEGERYNIEGLECFIRKSNGDWTATEGRTGSMLAKGRTKNDVLKKTRDSLRKNSEKVKKNIEYFISRNGISPLYK